MNRRRIFIGGLTLASGNAASALASFARNIIVARLVSVDDFGVAALFAMSMSFIEMASNLGIDRLLVQARDGSGQRLQATGQAFQAVRGLGCSLILLLAAEYIAAWFGVLHAAWAFQVLALVPAIRGFIHLDSVRYQRELNFAASIWIELGPQMCVLALVFPLGLWLGDYRVMLWLIVLQALLQLAVSHLLASRPYSWAWDREVLARMVEFGWPLLVNGLLMFVILQGDQAIVGAAFSMEELGWYSAAFMLTLAPAMIVMRALQSLLLPLLSRAQGDAEAFGARYVLVLQGCLLAGIALGAALVLTGPSLLVLLFGDQYAAGVVVISALALMQAARVAKAGPMIVAMSLGNTQNAMQANVVRVLGLAVAILAVMRGGDVLAVASIAAASELLGLLLSLVLLKTTLHLRVRGLAPGVAAGVLVLAFLAITGPIALGSLPPIARLAAGAAITVLATLLCVPLMREAAAALRGLVRQPSL